MKNLLMGIVAGLVIGLGAVVMMMPSMMIVEHESKFATIDETTAALVTSIKANDWVIPGGKIRNMNKSVEKSGYELDRQVRIIELCKGDMARDIIKTNPEISTIMPCAIGVYKKADGKVYLSGMNMGLIGKMFGGNIAKVVGEQVAGDEHKILSAVIK